MPDIEPQTTNNSESKEERLTKEYDVFLTKSENLENNPNVLIDEFTTISGKKIKRYNLSGIDFAFLSHTVGLNIPNQNQEISQNIKTEISRWDQFRKGEANNYISCSLITAEHISHATAGTIESLQVMLGFSHVEIGELILAQCGDAGSNTSKKFIANQIDVYRIQSPQTILKTAGHGSLYNEVLITRYSHTNQPKKPDFIITFDGKSDHRIDQAINYFDVPVINFKTESYIKKNNNQIEQKLAQSKAELSLEELIKLHQEIHTLRNNRDYWYRLCNTASDNNDQESNITEQTTTLEKLILDRQINRDKTTAQTVSKKFEDDKSLESLQEVRKILIHLAERQYPIDPIYVYPTAENNWMDQSHQLLVDTLTSIAPTIIDFYKKQTTYILSRTESFTQQEIQKELSELSKYLILSESYDYPRLNSQDTSGRHYDIVTTTKPQEQEKLVETLQQIYSAQNQLKTALASVLEYSQQMDQKKHLDDQNSLLEAASNLTEILELSKYHPDDNFQKKVEDKTKRCLFENKSEIEIIQTVRDNYQNSLIKRLYQEYLIDKFDPETRKIYSIITNPDQIPEIPENKSVSETIQNGNDSFKILILNTKEGENFPFVIYSNDRGVHRLEPPDQPQSSKKLIEKFNKKWFWRSRLHVPKLNPNFILQLKPNFSERSFLTKDKKNNWWMISGTTISKIQMNNTNINETR